ncbi:hypothetical protein QE152_g6874 [Popillia japonica]|uniref:Uncharacterized protein n=1 Tax=Popillia japonica TaxID=7064 RepID=A0AAW1MFG3_POPJA
MDLFKVIFVLTSVLIASYAYSITTEVNEVIPESIHSIQKRDVTSITAPIQNFLKGIVDYVLVTINTTTNGNFQELLVQLGTVIYGAIERVFPVSGVEATAKSSV